MLSDQDAMDIRAAYATGKYTIRAIAAALEVGVTTIADVIRGFSFAHLPLVAREDQCGPVQKTEPPGEGVFLDCKPLERKTLPGANIRRLIRRWVSTRQAISASASIANYEASSGLCHVSPQPPAPPDALCWVLTFEIILKKLTAQEYRALRAWYATLDPPNATARQAIAAIAYECRVRRFH